MADTPAEQGKPSESDVAQPPSQHPLVAALKGDDPNTPVPRRTVITGLIGHSDRNGYQRLYLTTALDYYAEFPLETPGIIYETVPPEQSPLGVEATRVTLPREVTITFTWVKSSEPVDQFDLDIRFGPGSREGVPEFHLPTRRSHFPCFITCGC